MAREEIVSAPEQPVEFTGETGAIKRPLVAGLLAVTAVVGFSVYKAEAGSSGPADQSQSVSANIDPSNCASPTINVVPGTLGSEAVMPAGDMSSNDAVVKTESGWFSNKPLGKNLDPGRSAVIYATTVKPATQTKGATQRAGTEYQAWFSDALQAIKSNPGNACEQEANLLNQDSGYGQLAGPGATVEKVVPHFGSNGDISSIALENYVVKPGNAITGLIIRMGQSTKNEVDYPAVAVTSDGEEYMTGVSPTPEQGGTSPNTSTTTTTTSLPEGGTTGTATQGGSSSETTTGPAGSGTGQRVGPNGTTPENLPNGPLTGPTGSGPSAPGGPAEAAPGPGQTPGPGGPGTPGTPGTSTPPETAPPQTSPPETAPPQTAPPTTEQTVPPTTATTVPSTTSTTNKSGTGCDPNIAKC